MQWGFDMVLHFSHAVGAVSGFSLRCLFPLHRQAIPLIDLRTCHLSEALMCGPSEKVVGAFLKWQQVICIDVATEFLPLLPWRQNLGLIFAIAAVLCDDLP
jgi:hypothetical protein